MSGWFQLPGHVGRTPTLSVSWIRLGILQVEMTGWSLFSFMRKEMGKPCSFPGFEERRQQIQPSRDSSSSINGRSNSFHTSFAPNSDGSRSSSNISSNNSNNQRVAPSSSTTTTTDNHLLTSRLFSFLEECRFLGQVLLVVEIFLRFCGASFAFTYLANLLLAYLLSATNFHGFFCYVMLFGAILLKIAGISSASPLICVIATCFAALQLLPLLWLRREECPICCESVPILSMMANTCGHRCCRSCLKTFIETDSVQTTSRIRHARAWHLRCFGGCGQRLDRVLAFVGSDNAILRDLILRVTLREQLVSRCPPASRVLECPSTDCVGVGYSGQQTAMCFICETSWNDPDYGVVSRVWNWVKGVIFPETIDGVHGWRPCPHCGAAILKDGGCNNMRCGYCDQVFLWGPFRNTVAGVFEPHAPPSNRRNR